MRKSTKSTAEKNSFHLKIFYSSIHSINLRRIFKRNGNLSRTLKPTITVRASYCIQFEMGTKTVKILKFNEIFQGSEQLIMDHSEWRVLESKRVGEFEKELAMSESTSRKKYGFSYDWNEKIVDELVDLGYGNSFHLLSSEHLLERFFLKNGWIWHFLHVFEEVFQSLENFPTRLAKNWNISRYNVQERKVEVSTG